jgi:hypothetical protein
VSFFWNIFSPNDFGVILGYGMTDETYSEEETERRAAAALKRMLQTPHKPHKDSKKGKR